MDHIREFFYWTASIALILLSLFLVGLIALLIYLRRLAKTFADRGLDRINQMSEQFGNAAKTFRNIGLTRLFFRFFRLIF
jgi:hypothetical protein